MNNRFRKVLLWLLILLVIPLCRGGPLYATNSDTTGYTAESGETITLTGNNIYISYIAIANALSAKENSRIEMTGGSIESYQPYISTVLCKGGTIILKDVDILSMGTYNNRAMLADEGGVIQISGGSFVTEKYHAIAISARGESTVDLTNVDITTYGWNSYGVLAEKNSQLTMTGGSIKTYNLNGEDGIDLIADSYGAYANGSGALITLNGVDVSTYNSNKQLGAWALAAYQGGKIIMNGGSVYTDGKYSYGLASTLGEILVNGISIETIADETHAAYVYYTGSHIGITDTEIKTAGDGSYGLLAWDGSKLDMTGGSITTSGAGSYGVSSQNLYYPDANTSVTISGTRIETSGSAAHGLRASGGGAILADALSVKADDALGAFALYSTGARSAIHGTESLFNIEGAIVAENQGSIDITLGDGSYLRGRTSVTDAGSELEMKINGADSRWDVTSDSTLTGLTLSDSIVDYRNAALETTITVENLNSGNTDTGGSLFMKTDIANETADLLIVTGATAGSHTITVRNNGYASTTGDEVTVLVRTADQNGSFSLSRYVDAGGWRYGLEHNTTDYDNGAAWELVMTGPSPAGSGGVNAFYASYLLSYAEMETLIKRLGDLRQTTDEHGLWVRLHGGAFKSNSRSYAKPFDMDYYGVHIGYDRKIATAWDGDVYAGIMFGYSRGDLDYCDGGTGEVDSKMIGLYGTWIHPGGFFADLVLKYQWMDNDMDVFESDGARVTGNGVSTGGFGASLELGQRIRLGRDKAAGWYIEPQVQLSYLRQDGGYFRASNGLRVGVDGYTALLGRLGALVGYENDARTRNFYAKVSKVKDFEGDITIRMNGDSFAYRFGNSWWVYGVGFTAKLNDRNSLYLDLERTSGAYFTQDWSIRAGWRKTF